MRTGVAVMSKLAYGGIRGPRYIEYGWVYVVVVIALIALIFIRVYGRRDRSRGEKADRSEPLTVRRVSRVRTRKRGHQGGNHERQGGNHGHQATSRRRPNEP